ncbi:MAG: aminotransferase class I/II-fold pyridoxal phosphate-dependent enzyme, partial [Chitinophagales bacterium]|nr:aminotransferase class I/II-fold pyridoxal phosphate-dependent enzyme [Chitinophagales bacterium]
KRYSACGARIGAIVTRNRDLLDVVLKFGQARLSPPSLGQIAGAALFDLPKEYYNQVIQEYEVRRNALIKRLQNIEGVKCPVPGGAFYCVAELPVDDADEFCRWMLEEFSLHNNTVMLAPASGFYTFPEDGKKQVRIAYILNQEKLNFALDCLEAGLKTYVNTKIHSENKEALVK